MNKKLMIYLCDYEFLPILRHGTFLKNYEINHIVSPNGLGINGMDAGVVDGGPPIGWNITNDFEKALDYNDAVLFTPFIDNNNFYERVLQKLEMAIQRKKDILCAFELEKEKYDFITSLCKKNNVIFEYYVNKEIITDNDRRKRKNISTPIIFVLGLGERTHKFEIQLCLREYFSNLGYTVAQIGTKNYCEIFGIHSFPDFMFLNQISVQDKVTKFNNYVKKIEKTEKPDVIIIGIPGGIIPFDDEITHDYGIIAFLVSNAVTPDASICSLPFENYTKEFFNKTATFVKYRFGFEVDCLNISNIFLDYFTYLMNTEIEYMTLDSKIVDDSIEKFDPNLLNKPIFNVMNKESSQKLAHYIYNKLAGYGDVKSF